MKDIQHDRLTDCPLGQRFRAVDPTMAGSRQIPKAEPDNDGAVVRTIGAIPLPERRRVAYQLQLALTGGYFWGLVGRPEMEKPASDEK